MVALAQADTLRLNGKDSHFLSYPYNPRSAFTIGSLHAAGYGTAMAGLYSTWYKNYPQSKFHTFNDWDEWMQMDKFGHVYSTYAESLISNEMWRLSGMERKKRIWISGLTGIAYQTVIEVLDGFCAQWGFSWGDMGANVLGSGLFVAQELAWDEQKIQLKWSFHPNRYRDPVIAARSRAIFGKTDLERALKDYNGQTYWLSTGIKILFPKSHVPAWLQISLGTGINNVLGARSNKALNEAGQITFDRTDLRRYREWYLSPDIDLSKIPTRKKGVRMLLNMLNVIKIPAPALQYGNGKLSLNWLFF